MLADVHRIVDRVGREEPWGREPRQVEEVGRANASEKARYIRLVEEVGSVPHDAVGFASVTRTVHGVNIEAHRDERPDTVGADEARTPCEQDGAQRVTLFRDRSEAARARAPASCGRSRRGAGSHRAR